MKESKKINSPLIFATIKRRINDEEYYAKRKVKIDHFQTDKVNPRDYHKTITNL
jgi:hypothetical protein